MSQIGSSAALAESMGVSTALSPKTATTVLTTSSGVARSVVGTDAVTVAAIGVGLAATGVGAVTGAACPARPHAPVTSSNTTGAKGKGSFTRGT